MGHLKRERKRKRKKKKEKGKRERNKAGYTATPVFGLLQYLGKSSEAKDRKNIKKVKWGPTDQPTDRPTDRRTDKAAYRVACTRLKIRYSIHRILILVSQ